MKPLANRPLPGALALLCLALASGGCALFAPRPALPPMPRQEIITNLRRRTAEFSTLVDGDISLKIATSAGGKTDTSPTLGGHVAFDRRLPGLWLHAAKVGREVFDLKALGMQFSLRFRQTGELLIGGPVAYARLPYLIRPDEVQTMFGGPDALGMSWPSTTMALGAHECRFDVDVLGALFRRITVEPGTADILRIENYDVRGRLVTDIRLSDYRAANSARFPRRLIIDRPLDGVQVELRLGGPKLNKAIPRKSFEPHPPAGWSVIDLDRQPLSDVRAFTGER